MNVVRTALEIVVVSYRVLPETSLPKQILAAIIPMNAGIGRDDAAREPGLD